MKPRPCACRFAPYPHNDNVCRAARMPTRTPRPDKPKGRQRFKPGERGKRRGVIYEQS